MWDQNHHTSKLSSPLLSSVFWLKPIPSSLCIRKTIWRNQALTVRVQVKLRKFPQVHVRKYSSRKFVDQNQEKQSHVIFQRVCHSLWPTYILSLEGIANKVIRTNQNMILGKVHPPKQLIWSNWVSNCSSPIVNCCCQLLGSSYLRPFSVTRVLKQENGFERKS